MVNFSNVGYYCFLNVDSVVVVWLFEIRNVPRTLGLWFLRPAAAAACSPHLFRLCPMVFPKLARHMVGATGAEILYLGHAVVCIKRVM